MFDHRRRPPSASTPASPATETNHGPVAPAGAELSGPPLTEILAEIGSRLGSRDASGKRPGVVQGRFVSTPNDAAGQSADTERELPRHVRDPMSESLGVDLGAVRIFEGEHAERAGARAFARGTDVHFAPGAYDPSSQSGLELIGHELAHVAQQAEGRVSPTATLGSGMAINADPGLEAEADRRGAEAARHVVGGSGSMVPSPALARPAASEQGVAQGVFVDEEDRELSAEEVTRAIEEQGVSSEDLESMGAEIVAETEREESRTTIEEFLRSRDLEAGYGSSLWSAKPVHLEDGERFVHSVTLGEYNSSTTDLENNAQVTIAGLGEVTLAVLHKVATAAHSAFMSESSSQNHRRATLHAAYYLAAMDRVALAIDRLGNQRKRAAAKADNRSAWATLIGGGGGAVLGAITYGVIEGATLGMQGPTDVSVDPTTGSGEIGSSATPEQWGIYASLAALAGGAALGLLAKLVTDKQAPTAADRALTDDLTSHAREMRTRRATIAVRLTAEFNERAKMLRKERS